MLNTHSFSVDNSADKGPEAGDWFELRVGDILGDIVFQKRAIPDGYVYESSGPNRKIIVLSNKAVLPHEVREGAAYHVRVVADTEPGDPTKGKLYVNLLSDAEVSALPRVAAEQGEDDVPFKEGKQPAQPEAERRYIPPIEVDEEAGKVYVLETEIPLNPAGGDRASRLQKFNYFTLDQRTLETLDKVATAVERAEPLLLEGETSTSKTSSIEYLAAATGNEVVRMNLNGQTDTSELIGKFVPNDGQLAMKFESALKNPELLTEQTMDILTKANSEGRGLTLIESQKIAQLEGIKAPDWQWKDGLDVVAKKEGKWLILDELNLAESQILERLNSQLEKHRSITLSENGGVVIRELNKDEMELYREGKLQGVEPLNPNFRIMGTMNPAEYAGRSPMSPAYKDRWTSYKFVEAPRMEDYAAMMELMVYGEQPEVTIRGKTYRAPEQEPLLEKLAEVRGFQQFIPRLAKFQVTMENLARNREIGKSKKEKYIFTRRGLIEFMGYLEDKSFVDRKTKERMTIADNPAEIISRALQYYFLDKMGNPDDLKKMEDQLGAIGLTPQHLRQLFQAAKEEKKPVPPRPAERRGGVSEKEVGGFRIGDQVKIKGGFSGAFPDLDGKIAVVQGFGTNTEGEEVPLVRFDNTDRKMHPSFLEKVGTKEAEGDFQVGDRIEVATGVMRGQKGSITAADKTGLGRFTITLDNGDSFTVNTRELSVIKKIESEATGHFNLGDKVEFVSGPRHLLGKKAIVVAFPDSALVQVQFPEGGVQAARRSNLKKIESKESEEFKIGDEVEVIDGIYRGNKGIVRGVADPSFVQIKLPGEMVADIHRSKVKKIETKAGEEFKVGDEVEFIVGSNPVKGEIRSFRGDLALVRSSGGALFDVDRRTLKKVKTASQEKEKENKFKVGDAVRVNKGLFQRETGTIVGVDIGTRRGTYAINIPGTGENIPIYEEDLDLLREVPVVNVGDRVKILSTGGVHVGEEGTISEVRSASGIVQVDFGGKKNYFKLRSVERVAGGVEAPDFKVGDEVEVVSRVNRGERGKVIGITPGVSFPVEVEMDAGGEMSFDPAELRKVEAKELEGFKIGDEVEILSGAYAGKKVIVITNPDNPVVAIQFPEGGTYTMPRTDLRKIEAKESEWFNLGDEVEVPSGQRGVVISTDAHTAIVEFPPGDRGSYLVKDLKKVKSAPKSSEKTESETLPGGFKVGDRVRIIESPHPGHTGREAKVVDRGSIPGAVRIIVDGGEHDYHQSRLQKIEGEKPGESETLPGGFKVGDRVRIIESPHPGHTGREAKVVDRGFPPGAVRIRFDGEVHDYPHSRLQKIEGEGSEETFQVGDSVSINPRVSAPPELSGKIGKVTMLGDKSVIIEFDIDGRKQTRTLLKDTLVRSAREEKLERKKFMSIGGRPIYSSETKSLGGYTVGDKLAVRPGALVKENVRKAKELRVVGFTDSNNVIIQIDGNEVGTDMPTTVGHLYEKI